jgi:hypothetical protein
MRASAELPVEIDRGADQREVGERLVCSFLLFIPARIALPYSS